MKKVITFLKQKWDLINPDIQDRIVTIIFNFFNYLFNALLLSIPIAIIFFVLGESFKSSYFYSVICVWIFIPYMEHYYVWFRDKWKDDIDDKE